MAGQGVGLYDIDMEEKEQEIVDLQWRNDGTIWVQTGKASYWHDRGEFRYDMFTKDGRYDSGVRVFLDGDANLDLLKFLGSDQILLIRGFKDSLYKIENIKRPWTDTEPIVQVGLVCYALPDFVWAFLSC